MIWRIICGCLIVGVTTLTSGCEESTGQTEQLQDRTVTPLPTVPPGSGPFFPMKSDVGFGVVDQAGTELIEPMFLVSQVYATRSKSSLCSRAGQESVILSNRRRWIVLDALGSRESPPPYRLVRGILNLGDSLFAIDSLAELNADDQWGRIPVIYDLKDRWNPPEGVVARGRVSEGKVAISLNGKLGYADRDGNVIVQPQFEHAEPFYEDRAAVCKQGRWGYINPDGKLVILLQYRGCSWFDSGVAIVKPYDQSETFLIDKDGKKLRDFPLSRNLPDGAFDGFEDGLFRKQLDSPMEVYGFVNPAGDWVIEGWGLNGPTSAATFANGPAIVTRRIYDFDPNSGKFFEGLHQCLQARYILYRDGTLGPALLAGESWNPFRFGLAASRETGAYVNEQGKVVWKPQGLRVPVAMFPRDRKPRPYSARYNQHYNGKLYLNGKPVTEEKPGDTATEKREMN